MNNITTFVGVNKSVLYMVLSGLCFIVINTIVKLLGSEESGLQSYPAYELVLARSVVSILISLVVIKRKKIPVFGNNKKWLIIRGMAGMIALTIFFSTIQHLPLAVAITVQYLAPIFTIIFAMILLKERVKLIQWGFIALSFSGVLLILFSNSKIESTESLSFYWIGLGIISAVLSGVAYTSIMKLKATDKPITIVFYFPLVSIPFMTILCFFEFTTPQGIEWLYLLLIGIFTQLAQVSLTWALHGGKASTITPIQYFGAAYAILIGYFIFGETLSLTVALGMALVVGGVVINALMKKSN